jgi:hypothetical protein
MSTAAVSTTSIYAELQAFSQNRQTDVKQLGSALQSGDLAGAQQAYNTLVTLGQGGPFANAEPFSKNSRAQAFETIGQDLQNGDLAGAQAAFATLTAKGNNSAQAAQSTPAAVVNISANNTNTAPTDNTNSIYAQLQAYRQTRTTDLAQLGQDLQAGNQTAAQTDVANLTALGQSGPQADGQIFERTDRAQDFQAIGQALQSGDLAGAETAYTALASTFGQPITGGKTASGGPLGPPVSQQPIAIAGPVSQPPIASGGPVSQPPSTSNIPEIVINLGGTSGTGASTGSATPEIVINLQEGNSSSGSSGIAEIDINFGGGSNTSASTGAATTGTSSTGSASASPATPELVINLGQGNSASSTNPEEITINLSGGNSGGQVSISSGQGSNAEQLQINLNQLSNNELILNLFNSNAASQTASSSTGLSVQA